ncbi:HNH endonuclease [Herbaspirillum aquaticum]|uniref:HNH endonuclease n=1 Tax=Herbaspirillum aquaticum TaxID=568783 RepID=UPI0024DE7ECA|nr:HNH endonuclease signature motif containing protein [Herbaspirillum aquaticum]
MAGDWIRMRSGLEKTLMVMQIAKSLGISKEAVIFDLYRTASWFMEHGKQGKLQHDLRVLDAYLGRPGFAAALIAVSWAEQSDGAAILKGFCSVSAERKSLGRTIRKKVLASGRCAVCGATSDLVIDHKIPIVRGGSCDESNLQSLCAPCNRAKGRKTMEEFLNDR